MKKCKYCGSGHREYRDQVDSENRTFHIIECLKGCLSVHSFQSITNCRNLWNKKNEVTNQDMYDDICSILGTYYDDETLEQVRLRFKHYEGLL